MLTVQQVLESIQGSALSQLMTSERWPLAISSKQILETLHFLAFELQIGAIMVISSRLLGLGRRIAIEALARPVFRIAWPAFAFVLVTGVLQLIPIATEVVYRPSFQAKIAVLVVALATLAGMHAQILRRAAAWDGGAAVPGSLKLLAAFSLVLWPTVIIVARLMYAFVQAASP